MPGKRLPDDKVRQLVEAGKGNSEIARYLREHEGVDVTPSAIGMWRKRRGLERTVQAPRAPWSYRPKSGHAGQVEAVVVRAWHRREAGLPLDEQRAAILAGWEHRLYGAGLVLHYDPDTPQGWWYVPAEPGVDLGIIREPDRKPRPPREDWRKLALTGTGTG